MSNKTNSLTYKFTVVAQNGKKFFEPQNQATADLFSSSNGRINSDTLAPNYDMNDKYIVIRSGLLGRDIGKIGWHGTHGASIYFQGLRNSYNQIRQRSDSNQHNLEAKYFKDGDTVEITSRKPLGYGFFQDATPDSPLFKLRMSLGI